MGEMRKQASSWPKRRAPRVRSSMTASEARKSTSPMAVPPIGVAMKSLVEGYSHSMKSSHMPEPAMAKRLDCQ